MKKMSLKDILLYTSFWFAVYFLWSALMVLILPAQVEQIVGLEKKTKLFSTLLSLGAFVAMITQPIFGAISDRTTFTLGRRRPFIIIGSVIVLFCLYFMKSSTSISLLCVLFMFLQFGNNLASVGFQGLLPDIVPVEQRGVVSSFMGIMTFLGTIVAFASLSSLTNSLSYSLVYYIIMVVYGICTIITCLSVKEIKYENKDSFNFQRFMKSFYINPKEHPDFIWLLITSFLIMMGYFSIFDYLQYYCKDVLMSSKPPVDAALLGGAVLIGATIVSFFAGKISDKIGRIKVVFYSCLLMILTTIAFIINPGMNVIIVMCVIFGFGYGAYMTVQWALVTDCLPNADSYAKDLGIWTISSTLPQVLAPIIGGVILASNSVSLTAYRILFFTVILYLIVGSYTVFKIKKKESKISKGENLNV